MTVAFRLGAATGLMKGDIVMLLGVYANGESRFDLTCNPYKANMRRYENPQNRRHRTPLTPEVLAHFMPMSLSKQPASCRQPNGRVRYTQLCFEDP